MDTIDIISPIDQYVIDFVIKLRSDHKLSQTDIGNIIEVSRSYIADIENPKRIGKYNLTHINQLADYFNLSPRDFLPAKAIYKKQKKTKNG